MIARTAFNLAILAGLLLALPGTGQASPPLQINSCTTINTRGHYELVANLTSSVACIKITASHVHLKLNGHTITFLAPPPPPPPADGPTSDSPATDGPAGILVVGVSHVDIEGPGIITGFGRGVDFEGVDSSEVKGVTSTGNFFGFVVNRDFATPDLNNLSEKNWFRDNISSGNNSHGFTLNGASNNNFINNVASNNLGNRILLFDGNENQLKVNTANGNAGAGIRAEGGGASTGHTLTDNTANGNGFGIQILGGSTGNSVKGNTALTNLSFDLLDGNATCDNNVWMSNVFNTANQTCIQ
jgi:parallel beta-helix repeat protein